MSNADNYDGREYRTGREGLCQARVEVFSRIVGHYQPLQQWNRGQREQYHHRLPFRVGVLA